VDVESTGLDTATDRIIQVALVPFEYAPSDGRIFSVGEALVQLEDPGRPLSPEITALTGFRDEDLAGRRIDDDAVHAVAAGVRLVIAHNAGFDRPLMERRLPCFQKLPWACSQREVPWAEHGVRGSKLEYILWRHCREFFDAHRADADAYAAVHALATPFARGERPMALLLQSSRRQTARLWAIDSPYAAKDQLKARGYRWSPGEEGRPRAWYVDVDLDMVEPECEWLDIAIYAGQPARWRKQVFGAADRYSGRV
jgi:DNA polymerase-3 subunit epsilon